MSKKSVSNIVYWLVGAYLIYRGISTLPMVDTTLSIMGYGMIACGVGLFGLSIYNMVKKHNEDKE